ncbi:MAG: hypothetical protein R2828_28985 [Saprospiraceae bacterium]
MEKDFFKAMESKLAGDFFGPFRFSRYMLKYINYWELITYDQIKEIVELIKYNGSTYTFFPFCYLYLEIDLYKYYIEKSYDPSWNKEKANIQIEGFASHPLEAEEKSNKLDEFKQLIPKLKKIKKRLIEEGAYIASDGTKNLKNIL